MRNNNLIEYKENIFIRIINFFKRIISKKHIVESNDEEQINSKPNKDSFIENIIIKENEEEKILKVLQMQYDKGEIDEEDISDEDIDKLIEMYDKQTEELNADTERRKNHIAKMLKELKSS